MLGDTITLPSQACGREQLSDDAWGTRLRYHRKLVAVGSFSDDAWGHTYVTVARCRKLVAVGNLATMLGDTITLPSQACGRGQRLATMLGGHDYVTVASLWPWAA